MRKALESQAAYIALVSSRHRAALVLDYLAATGIPPEQLARVWAPAGLDIGAATPEEIALSIISQMVALRRGGGVQPLKHAKGRATEDMSAIYLRPRQMIQYAFQQGLAANAQQLLDRTHAGGRSGGQHHGRDPEWLIDFRHRLLRRPCPRPHLQQPDGSLDRARQQLLQLRI